jgi:hypothetical protein
MRFSRITKVQLSPLNKVARATQRPSLAAPEFSRCHHGAALSRSLCPGRFYGATEGSAFTAYLTLHRRDGVARVAPAFRPASLIFGVPHSLRPSASSARALKEVAKGGIFTPAKSPASRGPQHAPILRMLGWRQGRHNLAQPGTGVPSTRAALARAGVAVGLGKLRRLGSSPASRGPRRAPLLRALG